MFSCHGRGGIETRGGLGPYTFNKSLAPAGLKCNHASYSYCPPPFFSTTSITQRDMHVTVVGLHNGGGGCPNVAKGMKTVPLLCCVSCCCHWLFSMLAYRHNGILLKPHAACQLRRKRSRSHCWETSWMVRS